MRRTRAQLAEDRRILLEEVRADAPEQADELEWANATYTEVNVALGGLYGYGPIARAQARLRRETAEVQP